jgi:hypothetical protein
VVVSPTIALQFKVSEQLSCAESEEIARVSCTNPDYRLECGILYSRWREPVLILKDPKAR